MSEAIAHVPDPNIKVSELSPGIADQLWYVIGPLLEKSLEYQSRRITIEDVKAGVDDGMILVLLVWDPGSQMVMAALGCEMGDYPQARVFHINFCGGRGLSEWKHIYPALRSIAMKHGADQMEIAGRRGWKKFLPDMVETGSSFVEVF